ncbi:MAG TPA: hypothetical protein VG871_07230 [Vicinamibacterales bacterium]|nr:hypothetical protein [Vicinamibacterales bacterium]
MKSAPNLTFEGAKTDKKVSGQIGFQVTDFTLTLGASADLSPGSDNSGPTTLATLDGLANKTTGTLSVLWSHWKVKGGNPLDVLKPACEKYAMKKFGKSLLESGIVCDSDALAADASDSGREIQKGIMSLVDPGVIFFSGAQAQAAPEQFTYVSDPGDPSSVADETKESHTSWSAGVTGGVVLPTNTTLSASVNRQVTYNAGKSGQICSPVGTQGLTSCRSHVLSAPGDPDRSYLISFEMKQFIGTYFALAPRFEFDVTKNAQVVALPIYLFRDGDGGLNGGVTIGWRSDTKAVTASAFVGDVLTLITKAGSN